MGSLLALAGPGGAGVEERVVDDVCIAWDPERVEFASANPVARSGSPLFLVPSDIPNVSSANVAGAAPRTGLTVTFWKHAPEQRTGRIADWRATNTAGCHRSFDHGLSRLVDRETRAQCTHRGLHHVFVPESAEDATLHIQCGKSAALVACRMTETRKDGWEVTVSLPRAHLSEWRNAMRAAHAFFEDRITDCEDGQ